MCHLGKILKPELPSTGQCLHGNHHSLLPTGLLGNSTQGNQLYYTLIPLPHPAIPKFLHCHTSVVIFGFGILTCVWLSLCTRGSLLACTPAASHLHLQNLFCPQSGIAAPLLTHILLHLRTSALASDCYRAETWEGDKNGIRGREADWKWEAKTRWNFLGSSYLPPFPRTHPISLLSSKPLLGNPGTAQGSNEFLLSPPPTLSPFSDTVFKWLMNGEEEKWQNRHISPLSSGSTGKYRKNCLLSVCLNWFFHVHVLGTVEHVEISGLSLTSDCFPLARERNEAITE